MNVTFTSEAPALDAPNTTIKLVADDMEHDAADAPPTTAEHTPPCAGVMKWAPVTVMELDWYPAIGYKTVAIGGFIKRILIVDDLA